MPSLFSRFHPRRLAQALFFDASTRRFIRHNARRWRGWTRRGAQDVVLVELIDWTPSIYCYSFTLNHLARRFGASIECFWFYDPRRDSLRWLRTISRRTTALYRSFGARVTLTQQHGQRHRERARSDAAAALKGFSGK